MQNEHKGGGFFNGFILGLLVGAGLVFLFGTQKGKRVLQLLLEQVEENTELSDLLEMSDDEEEGEYYDAVEAEPEEIEAMEEELPRHAESTHPNGHSHEEKISKPVSKVKRFFKGAHKRMVS